MNLIKPSNITQLHRHTSFDLLIWTDFDDVYGEAHLAYSIFVVLTT